MTTEPFTGMAFQSAAARRGAKELLKLKIEHVRVNDDDTLTPFEVVCRIDPKVDITRFGVLFGAFTKAVAAMRMPTPTENDTPVDQALYAMDTLASIDKLMPSAKKALRETIIPHDRAKFDEVEEAIDVQMLTHIIARLTNELSGLDPTQLLSSSDGSQGTGLTSRDGDLPAESTSPG